MLGQLIFVFVLIAGFGFLVLIFLKLEKTY